MKNNKLLKNLLYVALVIVLGGGAGFAGFCGLGNKEAEVEYVSVTSGEAIVPNIVEDGRSDNKTLEEFAAEKVAREGDDQADAPLLSGGGAGASSQEAEDGEEKPVTGDARLDAANSKTAASSEVTTAPAARREAYTFRNDNLLSAHFQKHGSEFTYATKEEYQAGADKVIRNKSALYKTEGEDGDGVYYIEATNEIVFLSSDGYIRTYFKPSAGKSYFDRQ